MIHKLQRTADLFKLVGQINAILDEYTPATGKPLFDADDVPLKDTRLIWKDIIKTN